MVKVENITGYNGNEIVNQFVITETGRITFQSYNSTIAIVDFNDKVIYIGKDYNYSTTTGKYRNIFFSDYAYIPGLSTLKGLEKAMKDGRHNNFRVERL